MPCSPKRHPPSDIAEPEHKKFGAKDIFDLSWRNLLDAYTCTECGRCAAACPANITGKKLSPQKNNDGHARPNGRSAYQHQTK